MSVRHPLFLGPLCEGDSPQCGEMSRQRQRGPGPKGSARRRWGRELHLYPKFNLLLRIFRLGHKQPGDQAERRQPHDDEHGAGQPAHAAAQQPPHSVEPPDAVNAPVDAADNGKQKQNLFETRHGWTLLCRRVCAEWMAFMRSRTVGAGHARPAAFQ